MMKYRNLGLDLLSMLAGAVAGGLFTFIALETEEYGALMFYAVPFSIGAVSAEVALRMRLRSYKELFFVAAGGVLVYGFALMLLAIEGIICLVMALPMGLALAAAGALLPYELRGRPNSTLLILLASVGLAGLWDARNRGTSIAAEHTSFLDVDASPERVWKEVLALDRLPAPTDWVLKTGLACPIRTELRGEGVGAIRHCTLTTGSMPERVTVWEPGRRLGWEALSTPPPLKEINPFRETNPPHLHGYYRVVYGEFAMRPLPNDRTRLYRVTRYEHRIRPAFYWTPWCNFAADRAHRYVLESVKQMAERDSLMASKP